MQIQIWDLQSNQENHEHWEYYVIVFQEKKPIKHKKTKPQARSSISLWFCGQFTS